MPGAQHAIASSGEFPEKNASFLIYTAQNEKHLSSDKYISFTAFSAIWCTNHLHPMGFDCF